jgi:hypothetical protein
MSWNYRIIRHKHERGDYLALHEVYYANGDTDCTKVVGWTLGPIEFMCDVDETESGIIESLERAIASAKKYPVLNEEELVTATKRKNRRV